MTKFLLIGPSGVGKSTTLEMFATDSSVNVFDLDEMIKNDAGITSISKYFSDFGNQNFFNKSKEAIENLYSDKVALIAVGAGSIDYIGGHQWYTNQNTIVLTGDPEKIYYRSDRQRFHPTLNGYILSEFSTVRQELYANARHHVDVTNLTPNQVLDEIRKILKSCEQSLPKNAS